MNRVAEVVSTVHRAIDEIPEAHWDALDASGNPFISHRFLSALENSGCVGSNTGWKPRHFTLSDPEDGSLLAAMPCYEKSHSYGEYVFDWAWADAYHQSGLHYYPKLLCAVPFTPVTGPRILCRQKPCEESRSKAQTLLSSRAIEFARERGFSSVHWLFTTEEETETLQHQGLIRRVGSQFHWENEGYESFDDFLGALTSKKRKNIRRERRRVTDAGIRYQWLTGNALEPRHWETMYHFYLRTIYRYGARTYLSRELFEIFAETMADDILLIFALDGDRTIAGGIYFIGGSGLYGRYWGADDDYHSLHFETCYYQPIEYCIVNGLDRFEAGAQGSHKLARGLLPSITYSVHWLADKRFADAIDQYTQEEQAHIERYTELLNTHSPFRQTEPGI